MDTVGISEIEAHFLLVLYRCETIRPLALAFESLRPISNLAIEEILGLSSKDFNSITHKNSKLRAYGFLDKEKNLEIARKYNVDVSCIERSIRHAICKAYSEDPEPMKKLFRRPIRRPKCQELIAECADIIRRIFY